jgi:hypothetical protein
MSTPGPDAGQHPQGQPAGPATGQPNAGQSAAGQQPPQPAQSQPAQPAPGQQGEQGQDGVDGSRPAGDRTTVSRAELEQLRQAREELEKLQRAQMTEQERMQSDLAARDKELEELRAERIRNNVARDLGLPAALAEFLPTRGSEEEIKAAAERLKAAAGVQAASNGRSVDLGSLRSGSRTPGSPPVEQSANDWFRSVGR